MWHRQVIEVYKLCWSTYMDFTGLWTENNIMNALFVFQQLEEWNTEHMFLIWKEFNEFKELTSIPFIGKTLFCLFEYPVTSILSQPMVWFWGRNHRTIRFSDQWKTAECTGNLFKNSHYFCDFILLTQVVHKILAHSFKTNCHLLVSKIMRYVVFSKL